MDIVHITVVALAVRVLHLAVEMEERVSGEVAVAVVVRHLREPIQEEHHNSVARVARVTLTLIMQLPVLRRAAVVAVLKLVTPVRVARADLE